MRLTYVNNKLYDTQHKWHSELACFFRRRRINVLDTLMLSGTVAMRDITANSVFSRRFGMPSLGPYDVHLVHSTEYKSHRICLEACGGRYRAWIARSDDAGMRVLPAGDTASWSSDFIFALMAAKVAIDAGEFG